MKRTLLSIKTITTIVLLVNFSCAFSQIERLPNMGSLKKRIIPQITGLSEHIIQPRNYEINIKEKSYYNIKLGDFISDHDLSIRDGDNKLNIKTNSKGQCWAIVDYTRVGRHSSPNNDQYQIIAKKLYSKGTWILDRIHRFAGIYCVEDDIELSIFYTGSYLVVEFCDNSLKSKSILDDQLDFDSMEEFIAYQESMGDTPIQRENYAANQRQAKEDEINGLKSLKVQLEKERESLIALIDSIDGVFSYINNRVSNSEDVSAIGSYLYLIPSEELYQPLRDSVDNYNDRALALNENEKVRLYVSPIKISGIYRDASHGTEMFTSDQFKDEIDKANRLIVSRQNKLKAHAVEMKERERQSAEKKKMLTSKYGAAYTRYDKEGYYTGMSLDLVKEVTEVLLPKGFANGVEYFEGPFKLRFGFKNDKLVYFSGYF